MDHRDWVGKGMHVPGLLGVGSDRNYGISGAVKVRSEDGYLVLVVSWPCGNVHPVWSDFPI